MNKNVLFIHGAWASRVSFNYIQNGIVAENVQHFEYDCQKESSSDMLSRAIEECKQLAKTGKTVVVGHSLGGVLALYLTQLRNVDGAVTIASPINGVDSINPLVYQVLTIYAPIFKCIAPRSTFIKNLKEQNYAEKNVDIISTNVGFNLAMPHAQSDGVVSVKSQLEWVPENSRVHTIAANHHEVLMLPQVTNIINNAISRTKIA